MADIAWSSGAQLRAAIAVPNTWVPIVVPAGARGFLLGVENPRRDLPGELGEHAQPRHGGRLLSGWRSLLPGRGLRRRRHPLRLGLCGHSGLRQLHHVPVVQPELILVHIVSHPERDEVCLTIKLGSSARPPLTPGPVRWVHDGLLAGAGTPGLDFVDTRPAPALEAIFLADVLPEARQIEILLAP